MRRIIEYTLTIVTTKTWTISWREDVLHASGDSQVDPAIDADVSQETVQHIQQLPPVIEAKEVDVAVTNPVTNQTADEPPDDPYFLSIQERK